LSWSLLRVPQVQCRAEASDQFRADYGRSQADKLHNAQMSGRYSLKTPAQTAHPAPQPVERAHPARIARLVAACIPPPRFAAGLTRLSKNR
jgi:hypothetical protein